MVNFYFEFCLHFKKTGRSKRNLYYVLKNLFGGIIRKYSGVEIQLIGNGIKKQILTKMLDKDQYEILNFFTKSFGECSFSHSENNESEYLSSILNITIRNSNRITD